MRPPFARVTRWASQLQEGEILANGGNRYVGILTGATGDTCTVFADGFFLRQKKPPALGLGPTLSAQFTPSTKIFDVHRRL